MQENTPCPVLTAAVHPLLSLGILWVGDGKLLPGWFCTDQELDQCNLLLPTNSGLFHLLFILGLFRNLFPYFVYLHGYILPPSCDSRGRRGMYSVL